MKTYALVGNGPRSKEMAGLCSFAYDSETGSFTFVDNIVSEINVGSQFIDQERSLIYFVNEVRNAPGRLGAGGDVCCASIDADGKLTFINKKPTLSTMPAFCCVDKTRKYLIVCHHTLPQTVAKLIRNEDGTFANRVEKDDAIVVLFSLNDDGSIGEIVDVDHVKAEAPDGVHAFAHLHSVYADPTGELYTINDKGLDKIYTYKIDRENGKLVRVGEVTVKDDSRPRYGAFHKTLPIYYGNNEENPEVYTYKYDVSGKIEQIAADSLLGKDIPAGVKTSTADMRISSDCRHLYVSIRDIDLISVFDIDDNGALTLTQNINCGGVNPRGIALAPDGKFLFAADQTSKNIARFSIGEDGKLTHLEDVAVTAAPGNVSFITL